MELITTPAFFLQNVFRWAVKQEEELLLLSWETDNIYEKAISEVCSVNNKDKEYIYQDANEIQYAFYYRQLMEAKLASYFAYAVSNSSTWAIQPKIIVGDSPDIIFVFDDARIGLEVTEKYDFYNHDKPHIMLSAEQEVKDLWRKKGYMRYWMEVDLLVPYKRNAMFDIDEYMKEIYSLDWPFERIIIWLFTAKTNTWTYYTLDLKHRAMSIVRTICLETDKKFLY